MSKYGVYSGLYFPVFEPKKNSIFGYFSRSVVTTLWEFMAPHEDSKEKEKQL